MKMNNAYQFENLSPLELEKLIKNPSIVYIPLGTLEWHERHLPFGVDAFIAHEICLRTCEKTKGCVLPPLYIVTDTKYNVDGKEYRGMNVAAKRVLPGSVYPLDRDLFKALLLQLISNLELQGFRYIVLVAGHCETEQMSVINEIYKMKFSCKLIAFPREGVFFEGSLDHAGEIETRLMMSIKPNLVHMERLAKPYTAMIGDDPVNATKECGERQIKSIVTQLADLVMKEM